MSSTAAITEFSNSAEAIKKGYVIVGVDACRSLGGLRVTLTGGADLRKLFEELSKREGIRRPVNAFSNPQLPVWTGGYDIENYVSTAIPTVPLLGAWVLRHAKLGIEETTVFTLPAPSSRSFVNAAVDEVAKAALVIFREFHVRFAASAEARTKPGVTPDSGFFNQYLTATTTESMRRNLAVPPSQVYDQIEERQRQQAQANAAARLREEQRRANQVIWDTTQEELDPQSDEDDEDGDED